jgi:hypothetical protein
MSAKASHDNHRVRHGRWSWSRPASCLHGYLTPRVRARPSCSSGQTSTPKNTSASPGATERAPRPRVPRSHVVQGGRGLGVGADASLQLKPSSDVARWGRTRTGGCFAPGKVASMSGPRLTCDWISRAPSRESAMAATCERAPRLSTRSGGGASIWPEGVLALARAAVGADSGRGPVSCGLRS